VSNTDEYQLERMPATACLTILWQLGDQYYSQKLWDTAADWFLLSTHETFSSVADVAGSKCRRKAALCHIQSGQYAK
jgi:Meiosis protein SPO22/ZIP4 like